MTTSQIDHLGLDREKFARALDAAEQKNLEAVLRLRDLDEASPHGRLDMPGNMYIGHSGGKDSVVVTHLADQVWHHLMLVHTPKPEVTHPKTIEFLYGLGRTIIHSPPDKHSWLGYKTQVDGTRIAEHDRTDGRSTDVVIDGKSVSRTELKLYVKNGLFGLNFVYPIFDWSDEEVWAHIVYHGLRFSDEYLA